MLLISLMPYLGLYDKEIPEIANLQKYGERISIMEKKERVYASIDLDALDNNLENMQEELNCIVDNGGYEGRCLRAWCSNCS